MFPYQCNDCLNTASFLQTSKGFACRVCLSDNVSRSSMAEDELVYIPFSEPYQINELERMYTLVDGRYDVPGIHGVGV